MGVEDLVSVLDFDICSFALGVLRAASEEASGDKFVDASFVFREDGWIGMYNWVNGRMSLVVVSAGTRLPKVAVQES
jgi:hypothetical protein